MHKLHHGPKKTKQLLRRRIWFPNIDTKVLDLIIPPTTVLVVGLLLSHCPIVSPSVCLSVHPSARVDSFELFPFVILNGFLYRGYAYAMLVHTWVNQLLPQLLMEQFDTLPH